ncbi:MAG: PLP-dependent aminotransferase family protein [Candidatus Cohnella colombiensis]|uniref:PLP-dependent aminotransferase family protein n=1 Tax=Candidatus Cohnella colombiensis TaxID=3121368 RepID=A0AA95EWJ3_9BACL|nr:MAG: PLP-dependent aminotransferase family protein [Cohnella sp.]
MLFIPKFDSTNPIFYYEQLYKHIKSEIMSGRISEGTRLPSIRKLADFLSVSATPVETAYQQLLAEGFIESRPRKGYFVQQLPYASLASTSLDSRGNTVDVEDTLEEKPAYTYDFHISRNDFTHFPMRIWRRLLNHVLLSEQNDLLVYGDAQGEIGLRSELAVYLHQFRGIDCSPKQIIIGAEQHLLISMVCFMLKGQISKIGAENPGYRLIPETFKYHGFEVEPLSIGMEGVSVDDLYNKGVQLVSITPSHQFPMGMTMSVSKRLRLLDWAKKVNGFIIEDDYDGEFCYQNKPIPTLQGLDPEANVIYLGGFSQALTPDICIHYLVLPNSLLPAYQQLRTQLLFEQSSSRIYQRALQLFIQQGHFERHIRKMRKLYQKKHDTLIRAIEKYMGTNVEVIGRNAGFYILLRVSSSKSEDELLQLAKAVGIRISSASFTWLTPICEKPKEFLIGFSGLELELIEAGICLLANVWGFVTR